MQNLVVSQTVRTHEGGAINLGDAAAGPLGIGAWLTPRNMFLPHLRYHAKFSDSRSFHTSVITTICQKNLTHRTHLSRSL